MLAKTLNQHWVLIAGSTKVLPAVLFFPTAHLPAQDVSGAAQITHFEPCYEHPKMLWPPIKMSHNNDPILI
jgi:hypothetical protein